MNWWQEVKVGATLVRVDEMEGVAVFEHDGDGDMERWTVDLFTDEVVR
jgi:hypothetical protein